MPRVIVSLVLIDQYFYTSIKYKKYKYIGEPINIVKILNEKKVDELIIIDPKAYKNGINFEILSKINKYASMPLTYSGGIKNLEDASNIFKIGYEKIGLGNLFINNSGVVKEIVESFGSSSVVGIIDIKKSIYNKYRIYDYRKKKKLNLKLSDIVIASKELNVGEVLVSNISRNGMWNGLDTVIHEKIDVIFDVPVIHSGGINSYQEVFFLLEKNLNIAVSSLFSYQKKGFGVMINYPSKEIDVIQKKLKKHIKDAILKKIKELNL